MKMPGSLALDSSLIVRHLRQADPAIAARLKAAAELYLPLTALGELLYGIHRSGDDPRAVEQWNRFSSHVVLPRDENTASVYATSKRIWPRRANPSLKTICGSPPPPTATTCRFTAKTRTLTS